MWKYLSASAAANRPLFGW